MDFENKAQSNFFELETLNKPVPKTLIARIVIVFALFALEQWATTKVVMSVLPTSKNVLIKMSVAVLLLAATLVATGFCFYKTSPKGQSKLFERPKAKKIWLAIGAMAAYYLFIFALQYLSTKLNVGADESVNQQVFEQIISGPMRPSLLLLVLFLSVIGPIAEELIFRGILMNYFFAKKPWASIFLSTVIFGSIHLTTELKMVLLGDFSAISNLLIGIFTYFGMAFVFAFIYRKTGKIQYSAFIHILWNSLATLTLLSM